MRLPPLLVGPLAAAALAATAGCSGDAGRTVPPTEPPATLPAAGRNEGSLSLLASRGRLPAQLLRAFEAGTGCHVALRAGDASSIRAGTGAVDVALVRSDAVEPLAVAGTLAALDEEARRPAREAAGAFRSLPGVVVDARSYAVPVAWSAKLLLGDRSELVDGPVSARVLFEPRLRGEVAMERTPLAIAAAARYLGFPKPFTLSPDELASAVSLLRVQRSLEPAYPADARALRELLREGSVSAAWGDPVAASGLGRRVVTQVPREGAVGTAEVLVVVAGALHPSCARRFLAFALTRRAQLALARAAGGAPVTARACRELRGSLCALLAGDDHLSGVAFAQQPAYPDGTSAVDAWQQAWRDVVRRG